MFAATNNYGRLFVGTRNRLQILVVESIPLLGYELRLASPSDPDFPADLAQGAWVQGSDSGKPPFLEGSPTFYSASGLVRLGCSA